MGHDLIGNNNSAGPAVVRFAVWSTLDFGDEVDHFRTFVTCKIATTMISQIVFDLSSAVLAFNE